MLSGISEHICHVTHLINVPMILVLEMRFWFLILLGVSFCPASILGSGSFVTINILSLGLKTLPT